MKNKPPTLNTHPAGWRTWPITKRFANEACRFLNLYHNEQNEDPTTNGELWILRQFLPQASVVFDVGANIGDWSLLAAQHLTAPGAKIYAWEPLPEHTAPHPCPLRTAATLHPH